jgi:eukaryotic-like serine/threonine-protein kinase
MSKVDNKTLFTLLDGGWSDIGIDDRITLTPIVNEAEDSLIEPPSAGIDRYERRGLLGEGGMGAVHEAYDKVLHRPVATKSLHEEVSVRSPLWKRFYREAQITAQLGHPSIVPVYSIEFTDEHQPLMIMKQIQGVTLEDYIEECKECESDPLPLLYRLEQRIEIVIKVCDAMHYTHVKGVIHRDIKPENVMVGAFEDVYVMDWGVATPIQDSMTLDPYEEDVLKYASLDVEDLGIHTIQGQVIGTPRYMAPEQARGELQDIGTAADQYAVGMMLFEMIMLKEGREGFKILDLLDKAIKGTREWDLQEVDPRLAAILLKATSPKIEDRYDSMRALAQDLRSFLRDQAVNALQEPPSMKVWRRIREHPMQLVLGVTILFGIGSAVTVGSLWSALQAISKTSEHERVTTHLLGQTSAQSQRLDRSFSDVQRSVQRLAVRLESLYTLSSAMLVESACPDYHTLRDIEGTAQNHQYQDNWINIRTPVCLVPDGVEKNTVGQGLWLSSAMTPYLIEEYQSVAPTVEEFQQDFWSEESRYPIQWGYIGFADGVLLNYPGVAQFGEGYDPRLRPWFVSGKTYVEPKCGEPYPDASGSGFLLPCNQRVETAKGELLAVIGLDFLVDSVLEELETRQPKEVTEVFLLNPKGDVLFSSLDKGTQVDSLKKQDENRVKATIRFKQSRVVAAIQNSKKQGLIKDQHRVYVFSKLQFVPWTLVYAFDDSIWDIDL